MQEKSFIDYCSEENILRILIRERVKFIGSPDRGSGKKTDKQKAKIKEEYQKRNANPVYKELCDILPSRRNWVSLHKKERVKLKSERTTQLKNAAKALDRTISRDRDQKSQEDSKSGYLSKLDAFIATIIKMAKGEDIKISPPETVAMYKSHEEIDGKIVVTFRPISVYRDLKTKVLLKLASEYLTESLDSFFHEEILSYRRRREYHGEKNRMTKADDAIPGILKFRKEHETVWVAECDIKKFYDIINHDQVIAAINRLLEENENKINRSELSVPISILQTYLDAYNFKESVLGKSKEPHFWDDYVKVLHQKLRVGKKEIECKFGWPDESEFFESGAYSPETWNEDCKKIGIPQGGVLSTLICNILMNDVDRSVIKPGDTDQLFIRFGDDIILMHSSQDGCRASFEAYKKSLKDHQLIYHNEKSIGDEYKDGKFTTDGYWDEKTKAPFLWGMGEGNAAEWIGFVGYEVNCNGDVRLRKSTLQKQFRRICYEYHNISSIIEVMTSDLQCLSAFDRISKSIRKFNQLTFNPASRKQMHCLDRYRHNKRRKAERYLATLPHPNPQKNFSSKGPASYASVLEEMNSKSQKK